VLQFYSEFAKQVCLAEKSCLSFFNTLVPAALPWDLPPCFSGHAHSM